MMILIWINILNLSDDDGGLNGDLNYDDDDDDDDEALGDAHLYINCCCTLHDQKPG